MLTQCERMSIVRCQSFAIWQSKLKVRSLVEIFLFTQLSSAFLKDSRPASREVPGYSLTTTAVTIIASCKIWSIFFSFTIKSSVLYIQPTFSYNRFKLTIQKHRNWFRRSTTIWNHTTVGNHWPTWKLKKNICESWATNAAYPGWWPFHNQS